MKTRLMMFVTLFTILPLTVTAQDLNEALNSVDEKQVENWMGQAQKAQQCFATVDQAALQQLQVEAEATATEVQQLCSAGKRAEAQAKAVAYGKKLVADPNILQMKKCVGLVNMDIPQTTWADLESEATTNHVCDIDM